MSSVSASTSSSSGFGVFEIEPIDSGDDEVQIGVEPENTTRKLTSIKKLITEQNPLMAEAEIANLDLKSAMDLYHTYHDSSDWVTLDFKDSNKKFLLAGKALTAEELVNWCMQNGKDVVKKLKHKQATSSDVWDKFEKSGYKRMNPAVWGDYCKNQGIDNTIPVVFVDKENKTAIKVLDVG